MEPFPGISHGDLLKLVLSVAVLLGTARLLGELAQRIGQPPVVGEILAGVVLGPSILAGRFPILADWWLPQTEVQSQLLDVVALVGIMTLILSIGMETDLGLIRARVGTATWVGLGGLIIPFASGLAIAGLFPDDLLGSVAQRDVFALFLSVALALSAIPVLAKILSDLGLVRSQFGQTALAAGMIDDILGWALLGLVTSLATVGTIDASSVLMTTGSVAVFFLATVFIARPLAKRGIALVQDRFRGRDLLLSLVVVLAFAWGAFSHALHLEPILGAFAIGIIIGRSRRLPVEVGTQLESITNGFFAPIFLATAGLRMQVDLLLQPDLLRLTLILLAVAFAGKLGGAFLGARFFAGTSTRVAIAYGAALNARGVLGIVVAAIGLSIGIFGVEVYSMIVVVSIVTSLAAPMALKVLLREEAEAGAATASKPLDQVRRVLFPLRLRTTLDVELRRLEISVISQIGAQPLAVTLMTVVDQAQRKEASTRLQELSRMLPAGTEVTRRVATGDPTRVILDEVARGYDLLVLGASEPAENPEHLYEPTVDDLVRLAPCPSMVFTARGGEWPPRQVLVPTGGKEAASRAAELAFAISGPETRVVLFHVVDEESTTSMATGGFSSTAARLDIAQGIVDSLREQGESNGVAVATEVLMGGPTIPAVLTRTERDIDLLIVGTNLRSGSNRLYLGPKVERLLRDASCSTVIYNT